MAWTHSCKMGRRRISTRSQYGRLSRRLYPHIDGLAWSLCQLHEWGGGPPDDKCCWDLPPLPEQPPLLSTRLLPVQPPLQHRLGPVQPLQQQFRPLPHWIQWLGDDKNVHVRDFSLAESTNQQRGTQLVGNILGIQGLNSAAAKAGKINAKVLKWLPKITNSCVSQRTLPPSDHWVRWLSRLCAFSIRA